MTTSENKNKLFEMITEVLGQRGVEGFQPLMEFLLNAVMKAERSEGYASNLGVNSQSL